MLEQLDLNSSLSKAEYQEYKLEYEQRLGVLQREAQELNVPIIIIFEGWDAAGKGTLINRLLLALDPRGYKVYQMGSPTPDEALRPFLWRYWVRLPQKGNIVVFDRSWYGRVLGEKINKKVNSKEGSYAYNEIKTFERQLIDDGHIIIKNFLHISKKEQETRFKSLESNPSTAWRVTKKDWQHHKQYNAYESAVEEMLQKTDTEVAPWNIIEAHDKRFARVKAFRTVIHTIEEKLAEIKKRQAKKPKKVKKSKIITQTYLSTSALDQSDLSLTLTREEYQKELKIHQARILELEHEVYKRRIPVVVLYEGWDAAGKGGNIRRITQKMDPRGYEVTPIAAPNDVERAHHYLWRFWKQFPKAGHIGIFDRTWYGRVLVERVEGFCSDADWKRAYREINEMEEQFHHYGAVIVKFWVHIDQEEQLARFEARKVDPYKEWKITDEDWRNREQWDQYKLAVDEMLRKTSTNKAPWTVVESNSKYYARIKTLKTLIQAIETRLKQK